MKCQQVVEITSGFIIWVIKGSVSLKTIWLGRRGSCSASLYAHTGRMKSLGGIGAKRCQPILNVTHLHRKINLQHEQSTPLSCTLPMPFLAVYCTKRDIAMMLARFINRYAFKLPLTENKKYLHKEDTSVSIRTI